MTIKYRVVLFAASAFFALSASLAAAQTELTVIVYGGSFEEGWRKPCRAVREGKPRHQDQDRDRANYADGCNRCAPRKMTPKIDVIMMDEIGAAQANAEGL